MTWHFSSNVLSVWLLIVTTTTYLIFIVLSHEVLF